MVKSIFRFKSVAFVALLFCLVSCAKEEIVIEEKPTAPTFLTFERGADVKLVNRAELCKSVIADGKELIPEGGMTGALVVPELKTQEVYVTFKEGVTDFSDAFIHCDALKSIPSSLFSRNPEATDFVGTFLGTNLREIPKGLFANNPKAENFEWTFMLCKNLKEIPSDLFKDCPNIKNFNGTFGGCVSLLSIPTVLFDNNRKVTDFAYIFSGCTTLSGESPYTQIKGKKVHLYERHLYPEYFASVDTQKAFQYCTGLSDYSNIPLD